MTNQRPTLTTESGVPVADNRVGEALAAAWI